MRPAAEPVAAAGKVLGEGALVAAVGEHRRAGRRVVFTNGAFDLLHAGHVRLLEAARRLGDVLVVAVNDDASVRAAKGAGRPVTPAADRAEVLAALAAVTHVVVFPDATVDRLLRLLRPDVHAKGRDYSDATLPERETDRALGVKTAYVGDEKSRSSTRIAARLMRPRPVDDRVTEVPVPGGRAIARSKRLDLLARRGLLDLDALLSRRDGVEVNRHATRVVRRLEVDGVVLYLKTATAARRAFGKGPGGAFDEFRNHLALRAAGFRAPEPWLAIDGRTKDGRRASALLTREAEGTPLDRFLADRLSTASPRDRSAWARGIGAAVRALHTARFLHPDLLAYHLVVDGDPGGGPASIAFLDLARVTRPMTRLLPPAAAPGLAALALSLRPVTDARFRLAVLRAYLGGRLADARPWMRAVERRIRRVEGRGTFRRLAERAP
jgi:rfaE bifunctional protein nucleotidyltransferase chain/domain